jgi:hypothetical protein
MKRRSFLALVTGWLPARFLARFRKPVVVIPPYPAVWDVVMDTPWLEVEPDDPEVQA